MAEENTEVVNGAETPAASADATPPADVETTDDALDEKIAAAVQEITRPLQDRVFALQAENSLLSGQLAEVRNRPQPGAGDEVDDKALLEGLKTDPIRTIERMVERKLNPAIAAATEQTSSQSKLDLALTQELAQVREEYPELGTNKAFLARADAIAKHLENTTGKFPGMLYQAVSTAYAEFVKSGKLTPQAPKARPKKPAVDVTVTGDEPKGGGDKRSAIEQQFSSDQLKQIDEVAAKFFPSETVEKRRSLWYDAAKKADPEFSMWK